MCFAALLVVVGCGAAVRLGETFVCVCVCVWMVMGHEVSTRETMKVHYRCNTGIFSHLAYLARRLVVENKPE